MSWMDSWSRPGKHAAVPPPLYLTQGDEVPYCQTCGRVISTRKSQNKSNAVKYCSDRCRHRKPGRVDKEIEQKIVSLLNDDPESGLDRTEARGRASKGDRRVVVTMDEIEEIFFGNRSDPNKTFGRKKNRASRVLGKDEDEWKSVDMADSDNSVSDHEHLPTDHPQSTTRPLVRPPQTQSDVNGGIGGEKGLAERTEETDADLEKRQQGQRRAEEREMVRRAARRGIVFGFRTENQEQPAAKERPRKPDRQVNKDAATPSKVDLRKCEALMNGAVVEPS